MKSKLASLFATVYLPVLSNLWVAQATTLTRALPTGSGPIAIEYLPIAQSGQTSRSNVSSVVRTQMWAGLSPLHTCTALQWMTADSSLGVFNCSRSKAAHVSFTSIGTGAMQRDVQSRLRDKVSALDFTGVDPTGAADSTAGLQNWINAACAHKKEAYLPGGVYKATALSVNCDDFNMQGAGQGVTVFHPQSATGDFLTFGSSGTQRSRISARDFSIFPIVTRSDGANIKIIDVNTFHGSGLYLYGGYTCIDIDNTPGANRTFGVYLDRISASTCSEAGLRIGFYSNDTSLPADIFVSASQLNANLMGISVHSASSVNIRDTDAIGNNSAITLNPNASQVVWSFRTENFFGDTTAGIGVSFTGSGKIGSALFVRPWISSSSNYNLAVANSNVDDIRFIGGQIINGSVSGILLQSGSNLYFDGVSICNNSTSASNTHHGIVVLSSFGYFSVANSIIGECGIMKLLPSPFRHAYGIFVGAGHVGGYSIIGNNFRLNTAGPIFDGSTGGIRNLIGNMPGSIGNKISGHLTVGGDILAATGLQSSSLPVAALPACVADLKGMRYYVTDATQTLTAGIGTVVMGGGAINVPVGCDGAKWRIGG